MPIEFEQLLNKEQLEAINIIDGPIVVYAGAGTGKTRTLTYRIANMIEKGIMPHNILAITFTKKATNEMQDRLLKMVGPFASMCTISTIHALCAKILRMDIDKLDYDKHFTIIDEEDQLKVIGDCIDALGYDKKELTPKHVKKSIYNWKCFGLKPFLNIEMKLIDLYEEKNRELNQLDFQDLLLKVDELFINFPSVLEKYQEKFKYILVDEFQDTDAIQYHIIAMLASKYKNLFLVGDDDQSIYSWRGTNYENIKTFKADFPNYKTVVLEKNYRSTQTILDGCNGLISKNENRQKKELHSDIEGTSQDVSVYQALKGEDEVAYVINEIQRLHKDGYAYKDIAILYRLNSISRNFETSLVSANIPYKVYGGVSYMARREVKDLVAYFRLVASPLDKAAFARIANVPARGLGQKTIDKILEFSSKFKCSVWDAIDALKVELKKKYDTLIEFKEGIFELSESLEDKDFGSLFEEVLKKFNFLSSIDGDDDEDQRRDNIFEFKSVLIDIKYDDFSDKRTALLSSLDEAILASDRFSKNSNSIDSLVLSTVHSAKGLEFEAVFVVAFEHGIFPTVRKDEEYDEEEERRIAYVAVTRAKKRLYLTCATERLLYGTRIKNRRSSFMIEFINGTAHEEVKQQKESTSKVDRTLPNDTNYRVGEKIVHKFFGEGVVVSLNGTIGTICFAKNNEIKVLDMLHPAISKKE